MEFNRFEISLFILRPDDDLLGTPDLVRLHLLMRWHPIGLLCPMLMLEGLLLLLEGVLMLLLLHEWMLLLLLLLLMRELLEGKAP